MHSVRRNTMQCRQGRTVFSAWFIVPPYCRRIQAASAISCDSIATAPFIIEPGDVIVLAGKGHEDYQEIRGVKYPMDERRYLPHFIAAQPAAVSAAPKQAYQPPRLIGDVIVLAGKGHEDYQEIRGVKYPMDERNLIADILTELKS